MGSIKDITIEVGGRTNGLNGMSIWEAAKAVLEKGGYITRQKFNMAVVIVPTDTSDCCIAKIDKSHSRRGWQPKANDLIADDWIVVTEEEFVSLSEQ